MTQELSQMWQEYDLDKLQQEVAELFPRYSFDFGALFSKILSGDIIGALSDAVESVIGNLSIQALGIKDALVWLLVLGIMAAMITHFVEIFNSHQIADISFYFVYLMLITILLRCFQAAAEVTVETVEELVAFIKIFIPTYLLSVGVATGTTTASAYYTLVLILIYLVQKLLLTLILPGIYGYVLLSVINGIWIEERLALLTEFLEKAIRLALKVALGVVTGISIFQSMITPVIDSVKASALQKTVSAIPGIGNAADGVVDVVIGSAVVIKNSIGVVMLILLLAVCIVPLLKIFAIAMLLKLSAALLGIISDKRITACTDKVGNGSVLLFRTAGTALILFLITISVAAFTTNRGF